MYALKFGDRKVGLYNMKTEVYRRYEDGGTTLGKPAAFPWKPREKKETEAAPTVAAAVTPVSPRPADHPADPWIPYAVGGGVAGLLLLLVLAVQFRR